MAAVSFAHTGSPHVSDLSLDSLCSFTWAWHTLLSVIFFHPVCGPARRPDTRTIQALIQACNCGPNTLLFSRCEIGMQQSLACSVILRLISGLSLQRQFKSFLLSNSSFSFLSHNNSQPSIFILFPSHGSYLFSPSGQNNSSQLTPISSPTLSLVILFWPVLLSIHHNRPHRMKKIF